MKTLQQRLKVKGFNPGAIDGIDGPRTFTAWSAPKRLDLPFRVVSH
jgi:peptidoglycan hydrolase-like protein with peptidoglycan-binding domain